MWLGQAVIWHLASIASCTGSHAGASVKQDSQLHFLALPPAPPTPIQASSGQWLKIVTGGDETAVAAAQNVISNQKAFAGRHGYAHEVHIGNYAHPWIAYWHKIDVLLRELRAPNPPKVLGWFDLDLVVTNPSLNMLERILVAHPNQEMIVTEDAHTGSSIPDIEHAKRLVNTGVILVRSTPGAERVLETLLQYGREHRNAAYRPQSTNTLHEQDAFNLLLSGLRSHVWRRHIAVIQQRAGDLNLNTFARNLYDDHFQDPVRTEWTVGDFTSHCTGLRKQFREWCITDSIRAADVATAALDVCGNTTLPKIMQSSSSDGDEYTHSIEAMMIKGNGLLRGPDVTRLKVHLLSLSYAQE